MAAGASATFVAMQAGVAATIGQTPTVLRASDAQIALLPSAKTAAWTFGGSAPGPLLRVKHGATLKVRLVNDLAQPTTLCWHGLRVANAMDGVAGLTQAAVAHRTGFDYAFEPPDAGLFWYHPHVFPYSAEQIGRGLFGPLIVDETNAPAVDQDVLLVLADWPVDAHGQIAGDFLAPETPGGSGRIITVNGAPAPLALLARPGARIRLRVLNACAARIALLAMSGLRPTVIALDGQPSELFRPARDTVPLGPGSRCELMLDLPTQPGRVAIVLRGIGEPDRPLATFSLDGKALPTRPPVAKLPDNPRLPTRIPLERSIKRDLVIAANDAKTASRFAWSLGGVASGGASETPLFSVRRGDAVTLAFVNRTDVVQQMHVHGHVFRVLHDLDDGWDPYWRDSILVAPRRTKHIAFVADNPGKWVIESLILACQVSGLAGWFEVA